MIYLTFDSNIWIYSLDDSWRIENQLDYLEPWVESGEIKILLPQIILTEWQKHEQKQVEHREEKLKDFFEMAEEILPTAFFADYKDVQVQKQIISNQLQRVKKILDKAEIIPEYPEVHKRVIDWGIQKRAPMHKKSSVADAIIIYSLINYAENNRGNLFFFVSNNTEDFYDKIKKDEIHPHLKPDFERLNIKAFKALIHLTNELISFHGMKVSNDFEQKRRERIKKKIKERIYNPEYEKISEVRKSSFIINLNTLEYILKESQPTREQVIFVLALIDSDPDYNREFYKKVENGVWFKILKSKGVFNPVNNPSSVQVKEGTNTPLWEPLMFLEKLSIKIKEGKETDLIDEIISIVKAISEKPKDNCTTWYSLIKIISNLPNNKISKELLNFIPVWLSGNDDTILQSSELCNSILPKFLNDKPKNEDIEKTELILKHLFSLNKIDVLKQENTRRTKNYRSRVKLYYLKHILIDKKLISRLALHCSNDLLLNLANNLKKLRFDFPGGINFIINSSERNYCITAEIENKNLLISISENDNPEVKIGNSLIPNFEEYNEEQSITRIVSILKEFGIEYFKSEDNDFNLKIFQNALMNGSYFSLSDDSISNLNNRIHDDEDLDKVFAVIFRDILNNKIKTNPKQGCGLLSLFFNDNYYRLSFFSRVSFFVIGENWKVSKRIFWEQINNKDSKKYFSNHIYAKELYELLNKNQIFLNAREIKVLQKIIDNGPLIENNNINSDSIDYWKLRWYSALRDIEPFKNKYKELTLSQNLTYEHYENLGRTFTRPASISPFTREEILRKSNNDIVQFIMDFKPTDSWEGPNIEGMAETLGYAVENNPLKFSEEIGLYKNVNYIYAYRIIYGFIEAWKSKKSFNWQKVLNFIKDYLDNDKFYSGSLVSPKEKWATTSDLVVGSIGNLLTEGKQSDSNAFDIELLASAKEIIKIVVTNLKPVDDIKRTNLDYPTYSFNSTAGKTLRALLDYSLRRARNLKPEDNLPKWEDDVIALFEDAFKKNIIDGYIITGMYFQQFYYLDSKWITNKVKDYYNIEDKYWLGFMGGFAFGNPPFNKTLYELFYPHYKKVIINQIEFYNFNDNGIIRHIIAFYFWGYEYLNDEGLLLLFINHSKPSSIFELINFVWRQEEYLKSLKAREAKRFEEIIYQLWSYLANKYKIITDEDEEKNVAALSHLIMFVPQLTKVYTELILKSSILPNNKHYHTYFLIENLIRLSSKGNPSETAIYIGQILNSIPFNAYFSDQDSEHILELVTFLFENDQKSVAEDICNKITRLGNDFLVELHNKYKAK